MKNEQTYHMLMEACHKPACPVCTLVHETVEKSIGSLFYESILDPEARAKLRSSLGFCREHAWLALDAGLSDALGFAILYQDLVNTVLKELPALDTPRPCPACQQEREVTERAIVVLAKFLKDGRFMKAFEESQGLCLPHLRLLAEQRPAAFPALLDLQRAKMTGLHSELGEFIRKNDYRFQHEGFGAERDSYKRAVGLIIGRNRHRTKEIGKHVGWGKGTPEDQKKAVER